MYYLYINKITEIMTADLQNPTATELQKRMNMYLVKKNYRLAFSAFNQMNEKRVSEGLEPLRMKNLEARFSQ